MSEVKSRRVVSLTTAYGAMGKGSSVEQELPRRHRNGDFSPLVGILASQLEVGRGGGTQGNETKIKASCFR